ncbi:MAG TPA: methyltransferase domain-containing protein [Polyangia bacterium]|nr:methyltransferase domain-containing protein [Polyangia bacterium]
MLDLAGVSPGMRVLDLATGRGEPAIRAAMRVGPLGRVVGVEISDALLGMAKERAAREGLSNLDLRVGNAEVLDDLPARHFHVATVRWGLMYLTEPLRALAGVRRALSPSGALIAALLAEPERMSYYTLPRRLLRSYRELPTLNPEAPGPFRYADLDRIARDFDLAGFTLDHVEEIEFTAFESRTPAEAVAWVRAFGLTKLLRDLPETDQLAWERDLTQELEQRRTGEVIRLGGTTRLVRARPRVS